MKQCWVYVESGECVDAVTVEEAIAVLQPRYRGHTLSRENVMPEAEAAAAIEAMREEMAIHNGRFWA